MLASLCASHRDTCEDRPGQRKVGRGCGGMRRVKMGEKGKGEEGQGEDGGEEGEKGKRGVEGRGGK